MLLGYPDPDPSLFCTDRDTDLAPDPDPYINKKKIKRKIYFFVTSFLFLNEN
jgi:hypothetical protein